MKKILLLGILLFSLLQSSNASHIIGGEIGWTCLTNGKYQFKMTVYLDCSGVNWVYRDTEINIIGGPLPTNESGTPFNSILMKTDSNRWIANNYGDTSPSCTPQYGNAYTCQNSDQGTVIQFFFLSDPITLKGVPPRRGWKFFWESVCCRPSINVKNVNIYQFYGNMLLRAVMYPTKNKDNASPCIDSSPQFISYPNTVFCRGVDYSYNDAVIDAELDSLIYSWDRSYNDPIDDPVLVPFLPGYSENSLTPDKTFDSRNTPATIDSNSGLIKMAVYNGTEYEKFIKVTRVDAFREGVKIASVFRELPILIVDCDSLPNGKVNNSPKVLIHEDTTLEYSIDASAGQKIKIPIEIIDNDYWDSLQSQQQTLSIKPEGMLFSRDRINPVPCSNVGYGGIPNLLLSPCAILQNKAPTFDTTAGSFGYKIVDTARLSTSFVWQTDCRHLEPIDKEEAIFNFVFAVSDNHCPIPAWNDAVITIRLHKDNTYAKPRMNCLSESNGVNQISWQSSSIDTVSFEQLYIYGSNNAGSNFTLIDSISNPLLQSYTDNSSNGYKYYYIQSKNISCSSVSSYSKNSDTITTSTDSLKIESLLECIQLSWTEVRSSYGDQENRKYMVYREHPIGYGFQLIDSVINDISYCDDFVSCGTKVRYLVKGDNNSAVCNFRVDTVEINTRKSSSSPPLVQELNHSLQALDTLGFYQWFDCLANKTIVGETNRSFTPKDTGLFSVIITHFGCSDTSTCIPFFPVGLPEPAFKDEVLLYPNPTTGLVQIKLGKTTKEVKVQVRNIQGQMLQEKLIVNSQSFQLELPQEPGIYFIQLTNSKGEGANLKVVKQ